jgi:CelD/BcsL family acetyltransferase involved in cellulose biosynthesis
MTALAARAGRLDARAPSHAARFRVEFLDRWNAAIANGFDQTAATPFQDLRWLTSWYGAFAGTENVRPLIAVISDAATSEPAALVPLVLRVHNGLRIVEFADLNLTDYNSLLPGPAMPVDAKGTAALSRALIAGLRRLPGGADLLRMQKMPAVLGGKPNPLVALGRPGSCSLNGNAITVGADLESYLGSIKKMQLPRSWRVFSRYPGAQFRLVTDTRDALALLDIIDAQQSARMRCLGLSFSLDQDAQASFYRDLVRRGIDDGYVVMTALSCDEATIAAVLGIRQGDCFIFLRISNAGRRWSHCSPSRLIVERTVRALHAEGVRVFDLSIGNYAYKRRFGASSLALTDVSVALGWRGVPFVMRDRAAQWLRRYPSLAERVGRVLGKAPVLQEL